MHCIQLSLNRCYAGAEHRALVSKICLRAIVQFLDTTKTGELCLNLDSSIGIVALQCIYMRTRV